MGGPKHSFPKEKAFTSAHPPRRLRRRSGKKVGLSYLIIQPITTRESVDMTRYVLLK